MECFWLKVSLHLVFCFFIHSFSSVDWRYQIWKAGVTFTDNVSTDFCYLYLFKLVLIICVEIRKGKNILIPFQYIHARTAQSMTISLSGHYWWHYFISVVPLQPVVPLVFFARKPQLLLLRGPSHRRGRCNPFAKDDLAVCHPQWQAGRERLCNCGSPAIYSFAYKL